MAIQITNAASTVDTNTPVARAAAENTKADSVTIVDGPGGGIKYGTIGYRLGGGGGAREDSHRAQLVQVVVFKTVDPGDAEAAKKLGVRAGAAYLNPAPGKFEYLCDIDASLSAKDLCKQFGVEMR